MSPSSTQPRMLPCSMPLGGSSAGLVRQKLRFYTCIFVLYTHTLLMCTCTHHAYTCTHHAYTCTHKHTCSCACVHTTNTHIQLQIHTSLVPSLSASDYYRLQYEKSIFHNVSDNNLTRKGWVRGYTTHACSHPPFPPPVYAGQQVRILGENYTLEDEEDSRIGQVPPSPRSKLSTVYIVVFLPPGWSSVDLRGSLLHRGQPCSSW